MKASAITQHKFFKPAMGAVLTVLCGLALWQMPLGEPWVNRSYDYLFLFGARDGNTNIVLIRMDEPSYANVELDQDRSQRWDRGLHAELLQKLADDECPLVVLDIFLKKPREALGDKALSEALSRLGNVVLAALPNDTADPELENPIPLLPINLFLDAARTNWGVAWLEPDLDFIVRRHWPFPAPGPYDSLPWTGARLAGAKLSKVPHEQWIRYYENGPGSPLSYHAALKRETGYFRNKIVFIGNQPKTPVLDNEEDEFRTPHTRWTNVSASGVEIMATEFLNLLNREWLRRPTGRVEALVLAVTGILLGFGLCQCRLLAALLIAFVVALAVMLSAVSWSYYSNFWFPWLVIAGGQVPFAFAWGLGCALSARPMSEPPRVPREEEPTRLERPNAPGYVYLSDEAFGEGAFGKVWLVRNAIGEAQALKAVYQDKIGEDCHRDDIEFRAIQKYKPVSSSHPGLLHVDFVNKLEGAGCFYYVMELGDSLVPDWEKNPITYKPRNLATVRAGAPGMRLPVRQCLEIVIPLTEALNFLHGQGLTHRDIKPENIIFVKGRPKLADVGLVTDIRPPDRKTGSHPGTFGYMPPLPEPVGTVAADVYGLGMVLYVISTGRKPEFFPELPTTLVEGPGQADFMRLNAVLRKACQGDRAERYMSAAEMRAALLAVQKALGANP